MSFMDRLKRDAGAFKSERETPAGRRFELRLISADCNILTIGCIGLAIWFPPLIYAAALGHLAVGAINRCNTVSMTWFWLGLGFIFSVIIVALASVLIFGGTYVVQYLYLGVPQVDVANELRTNWILYMSIAIVMSGIVSKLFAHPGGVAELIEYKNTGRS